MKYRTNFRILLDTNILFELTRRYTGYADSKVELIEKILKNHSNNITIPDLVWAEFSAAFFQRGFPYEGYEKWYNGRFSAYLQVYREITANAKAEYLRIKDLNSVSSIDYLELSREIASIKFCEEYMNEEYSRIKERIKRAQNQTKPKSDQEERKRLEFIERQEGQLRKGKLLDGMDAQIFSAAILYAIKNSKNLVYLITMDNYFMSAANHLCDHISHYDGFYRLLQNAQRDEINNLIIVNIWDKKLV